MLIEMNWLTFHELNVDCAAQVDKGSTGKFIVPNSKVATISIKTFGEASISISISDLLAKD